MHVVISSGMRVVCSMMEPRILAFILFVCFVVHVSCLVRVRVSSSSLTCCSVFMCRVSSFFFKRLLREGQCSLRKTEVKNKKAEASPQKQKRPLDLFTLKTQKKRSSCKTKHNVRINFKIQEPFTKCRVQATFAPISFNFGSVSTSTCV